MGGLKVTTRVAPMAGFVKKWARRQSSSSTKEVPSKCPQDLYGYTSGRWIFNEARRKREKYLKFDVSALKQAITASLGSKEVVSIRKIAEGGFNRILLATCSDGREVLARLPYPSTEPKHLTTSSEVATMAYLRLNGVPVPRVYEWSSRASNPVGAEYILMEKLDGEPLSDIWFTLSNTGRRKVIEQVVMLEQKMFSLQLPASGSIYFAQDLGEDDRSRSVPLPAQGHTFCIGPMAHYSWWHGERTLFDYDRGPWRNSKDIFHAAGERELQWTRRFAKPRKQFERLHREVHQYKKMKPQRHVDLLEKYLRLAACLGYPLTSSLNRPVLRHPDLQPGNIMISDSLDIVGLIDWQHTTVVPLCLAAGIPAPFQNYGDPESDRFAPPPRELPPGFDALSPEEQDSVRSQYFKRINHFLYVALTRKQNEEHYDAIFDGGVILHQRLHKFAGAPWEGDSITLEAEMINAIKEWADIVKSGATACEMAPIEFSDESVKRVLDLHRQQQEMDTMLAQMREALGVDVNGWTTNEDFERTKALAQQIKAQMIEATDSAQEKQGIEENFPFDDFDEEE